MNILCIGPKNVYAAKRLEEEAREARVRVSFVSPREVHEKKFNPKEFDLLYVRFANPYFPDVIALAKVFQKLGKTVVDADWTDENMSVSKIPMYEKLARARLPIPKIYSFPPKIFPAVVKWGYGSAGNDVWLLKNVIDLQKLPAKRAKDELLAQEFIQAEWEYKVITVGYKVVEPILKFSINPKSLVSDLKTGVKVSKASYPNVAKLAEQGSKVLKRQLAKTDILEKGGKFYILEVNRSPGLEQLEKIYKLNYFGKFIKYLLNR